MVKKSVREAETETEILVERHDPSDPTFWIPKDPEQRARFGRIMSYLLCETDVDPTRRRDPASTRMGSGSSATRGHRRPKRR